MVTNVQLSEIRKYADRFEAVGRDLRRCSEDILSVKRGLRRKLVAEAQFENAFRKVLQELQRECISVSSLRITLESIAACYEKTETGNAGLLGAVHSRDPGADNSSAADPAKSFDDPGLLDPGVREYPGDIYLRLGEIVVLLYSKDMTQEELEQLARKILPEMPSKKDHYNRNLMMPEEKLPRNANEAREMGWNDGVAASCHQFTSNNRSNQKWVSPDGRYEVIFNSMGTRVVDADEDRGTYNFGDPSKDSCGHFVLDVIPWLIYGNSEADSTTFEQRRDAFFKDGAVDIVSEKIRETEDLKDRTVRKVTDKVEEIRENTEMEIERIKSYTEEKISDMKEDYNEFKDTVESYINSIFH